MSLAWAIPAQHYQQCVQGCQKNKYESRWIHFQSQRFGRRVHAGLLVCKSVSMVPDIQRHRAVSLCAGDATANLMWRLQNGEVRKSIKAGAVLLHIGSSDLTYASFQVSTPQCCFSVPIC